MANFGYRQYPPSILIISDSFTRALKLRQRLEDHGCQVQGIKVGVDSLVEAGRTFFDVIVLEIEQLDRNTLDLCNKLSTDGELVITPVVIILPSAWSNDTIAGLAIPQPVFYLDREAGVEGGLLQIIEEIHYLTYRYA